MPLLMQQYCTEGVHCILLFAAHCIFLPAGDGGLRKLGFTCNMFKIMLAVQGLESAYMEYMWLLIQIQTFILAL
jgi:hypothetical protein